MDYQVGSIADLISGLHTPNRPRVQVRAVTPVKKPPVDDDTPRTSPLKSVKARKLHPLSKELTEDRPSSPVSRPVVPKPVKQIKVRENKEKRINNFKFLSQLSDYESDGNTEDKGEFVKEYYQDKNGIVKVNKLGKEKNLKKDLTSDETQNETSNLDVNSKVKKNKRNQNEDANGSKKKQKKNKSRLQHEDESEVVSESLNMKKNKLKRKSETPLNEITNGSKKNKTDSVNNMESSNLSSSKKSKKSKIIQENNLQSETASQGSLKKSKKNPIVENNSNIDSSLDINSKISKKKKVIDENNDTDVAADANQENGESEEMDQIDEGLTDFQKAAQRRIQNKMKKEIKFEEDKVNRTIFIGNIPVSILKGKYKKILKNKFSPYGAIESIRIRNVPVEDLKTKPKVALIENKFHSERSSVSAYIKFKDPSSVEKSLVENNTKIEENHIRVDSCSGGSKPKVDSRKTLFLGNLPFNIEEEKLREFFEQFGTILSVRVIRDKKTQMGKGFGFVNFQKPDGVELALAVPEEDMQIGGKAIRLKRYNSYNPKDEASKNPTFGDNSFRNNQKSGIINNKTQYNSKKRDGQGNKLRKRNSMPNQLKKIKENKGSENILNSSVQNDSANSKPHDDSYKGMTAKKKKKNKINKGVLKKKRISKILTQDSKPRKSM